MQPEPGVLVWRTPAGRVYTTTPTRYPALQPRSVVGRLLPSVPVTGVCALPQFIDLAEPDQPPGQVTGGVIVSQIGAHPHHIQVAQLRPPACQQPGGPALPGAGQLV